MKRQLLTLGTLVALILGGGLVASQFQSCKTLKVTLPDTTVITAEIADTVSERNRGLSHRDSLATDTGMLFLFSSSDTYPFWMKDTRIPLDIVWIQHERVVDIASLEAEQGSTIPQYTPRTKANAVLELNQGQAAASGITIGQPIMWEKCDQ